MRFVYSFTLMLIFLLNSLFSFGQGRVDGFYKGKGNIELAFGGGVEFDSKYFAGYDKIDLSRKIYNASITISTGLFERLDLYLNIPYVKIGNEKSIQDGSLFLKYLITKKKLSKG